MTAKTYFSNLKRELHPKALWRTWTTPWSLIFLGTLGLSTVWHPAIYAWYAVLAFPAVFLFLCVMPGQSTRRTRK